MFMVFLDRLDHLKNMMHNVNIVNLVIERKVLIRLSAHEKIWQQPIVDGNKFFVNYTKEYYSKLPAEYFE